MEDLTDKLANLKRYIAKVGKDGVVVAFSGGVDSATLAAISHEVLGGKAVAVTAKSPTYTSEELEDAKKIAGTIGIKLFVIETNELNNSDFARNPENRCYFCKKELLKNLADFTNALGFKVVFEGTNFSDLGDHRPGFKAVQEVQDVYSPWMANKFTKDEIRRVAKQMQLNVHNKPALACLASRIPFNEQITADKLMRVDRAEQSVKALTGAKQVRVRDHGGLARIEVGKAERTVFCNLVVQDKVAAELRKLGFQWVTFDLEGYCSGSMLRAVKR